MADNSNDMSLRPLSYIDWVKSANPSLTSETDLFNEYSIYVTEWYSKTNSSLSQQKEQIRNIYRDLIKDITVNFTTAHEKRVLSQIDYTNKAELDIVIPYYVQKLKEITQYIIRKRQDVQFSTIRHSLKGSEFGTAKLLREEIISLLTDKDFVDLYPKSVIPAVSSLAHTLHIEVEPLYDTYQHYFDIDPDVSASSYKSATSGKDTAIPENLRPFFNTRYDTFGTNTEQYNIEAFVDIDKAIRDIFSTIPTFLSTDDGGLATADGCCLAVNIPQDDLNNLPYKYFVDGVKTLDNLIDIHQRDLVIKYAGTKMYYLSTGNTITNMVSGELFNPKNKSANVLNRYYSSHVTAPDLSNLKTIKDIGGYFIASKLGMLNYAAIDPQYTLDVSKLLPNTVYVFPDPSIYDGDGRGNTMTDQSGPHRHTDNISKIKTSYANPGQIGDIVDDKDVHKFYPYQSREETLKMQPEGISRSTDNIDFWEGEYKDIWSNADIYPDIPRQGIRPADKIDDLLISTDSLNTWKTDIYGNEYALYKAIHTSNATANQQSGDLVESATQDTNASPGDRHLFTPTGVDSYNFHLSSYGTTYMPKGDQLLVERSVYDRNDTDSGSVVFRNMASDTIGPLSSTLSGVFIKYETYPDILHEVYNTVVSIDVIDDVLIIKTPQYLVVERVKYNYDTNTVSSSQTQLIYLSLSGAHTPIEKFSNIWYDETDNFVLITKSTLHPYLSASNLKVIYPEIYKFNIADSTLTDMYTLRTLLSPDNIDQINNNEWTYNFLRAEGYSLSGTNEEINIVEIDTPYVWHNRQDDTLSFTYLGKDTCRNNYIHNVFIDTADNKKFITGALTMFKTNYDVFNYNFSYYNTLSTYFEAPLDRGSIAERNKVSWQTTLTEVIIGGDVIRELNSTDTLFTGSFSDAGVSGSPVNNPDKTILSDYNTAFVGTAVSANSEGELAVSGTDVLPYSHNTSYLLYNIPLSSTGGTIDTRLDNQPDIDVCFDIALYTYTPKNSAYMKQFTTVVGIQRENGEFVLTEDGFVLYQD